MKQAWTATVLAAVCVMGAGICARGQATAAAGDGDQAGTTAGKAKVLLVLPFDNRSGQPSLEWIREAAVEVLSLRFASAGFQPTSRVDRMYALDHLGLPQGFQPSRASSLKLAQTLDADSIVVGSFTTDGSGIVVEARLVDVPQLRMTQEVTARGQMRDLIAVFGSLAWKLTRELNPDFSVGESTFTTAGKDIRVDAFEQYIRGITEPDQSERLRHLNQAVKISPTFSLAWMALGREQYKAQQYQEAATAFAKVDRNGTDAVEAGFYRGLSLLFSGDYVQAERSFADVAKVLPLAEVVNNEGVAASRQGHDGTQMFMQAAASDPNAADYHFNLAVSLKRHGDAAGATNELAQCLKLRPGDNEAQWLQDAWKQQGSASTADPLERIVRTFDEAAFKQAAAMMEEMNAGRLSDLAPGERVKTLCAQAKTYLDQGLLMESEKLYQSAITADGKNPLGHAGLAAVLARSGKANEARKEAHASLELGQTADAYLVLAQLDLAAGELNTANSDVINALRLDAANQAAQELSRQIVAKMNGK